MKNISMFGLQTVPEVKPGDNLSELIAESCKEERFALKPKDIIVIASKIVSKAEGSIVDLSQVVPSRKAKAIAKLTGKDPVEIEIILGQSRRIVAVIPIRKFAEKYPQVFEDLSVDKESVKSVVNSVPSMLITITKQGMLASDVGLDYSNNPQGKGSLLPVDPFGSARRIRDELSAYCGGDVAVILTDTEIAYTHIVGSSDLAIGYSGISPVSRHFAATDRFGKKKFGGVDIVVDELAAAAALLMGQTSEGIPVVVIRGLDYEKGDSNPNPLRLGVFNIGIRLTLLATLKLKFEKLVRIFV